MKRFSTIALMLLVAAAPAVQAQGMKLFEGTWTQVLAEAKRTGKPIYLDAYASWCGPCKVLKRDIFPREDVGAYFNANYINVSMDMEKGEGIELAKKYDVRAYPTHLYFSPDGELVHRAVGGGSGDEMAKAFIQWAQDARDPSKQLYTLKRGFEKGERNADAMYTLAIGAADASMAEADYYALEYFRSQSDEQLLSEKNFKALQTLVDDFDHPGYGVLMRNRDAFVAKHGAAAVEAITMRVVAQKTAEAEGFANYSARMVAHADSVLRATKDPEQVRRLGQMVLAYYRAKEAWAGFASNAVYYIEAGKVDDATELNEVAWAFYEHVDDKEMIAKATVWAKRSLDKEPNYAVADTYAALLFKGGNTAEARKWAEHAIELGKKEGTDVAGTEELLAKMRN